MSGLPNYNDLIANKEQISELSKIAFVNALKRAVSDVSRTSVARSELLGQTEKGWSLSGMLIGAGKEYKVPGFNTVHNVAQKARKGVSNVDTFLGSLAAGPKWEDPSHTGFRKKLFTDSKDNYIKTDYGAKIKEQVTLPSISAPLKEVSKAVVPIWALDKGYATADQLRQKREADSYGN
jgi:hypothetical protein